MHPTTVNGMKIPKDMTITVDGKSVNNDPELWGPVDPFKFYPPR